LYKENAATNPTTEAVMSRDVFMRRACDADMIKSFTAFMSEGLAVGGEGVDEVLLLPLSEYRI
jgi:hypothetical protein